MISKPNVPKGVPNSDDQKVPPHFLTHVGTKVADPHASAATADGWQA